MTDEKTLQSIHVQLAKTLLERLQNGEASASDLNVARQFLKDNSIEVSNLGRHQPLQDLAAMVPFAVGE